MQYSLSKDRFHLLLAKTEVTRLDKLLIILFFNEEKPTPASEIQKIGFDNGLKECKKWNVSDSLGKSKGMATSIKGGWIITTAGKVYLAKQKFILEKSSLLQNEVADLLTHLNAVKSPDTKSFLQEAITCLESNQKRAAVVLSWVGAVSILYDEVVTNHLAKFNAEALSRDAKWKTAKSADDLARMKEFDFLNVIEAISLIGKNVKQELQQCLQLRNACGHPNTLKIGERKVGAHLEILILNVFSKF